MLTKIRACGVRGDVLRFIRGLYRDPRIAVQLAAGQTSVATEYARGLRQGCPGTPQQFLVFINDLVDGLLQEQLGVEVRPIPPPTRRASPRPTSGRAGWWIYFALCCLPTILSS